MYAIDPITRSSSRQILMCGSVENIPITSAFFSESLPIAKSASVF